MWCSRISPSPHLKCSCPNSHPLLLPFYPTRSLLFSISARHHQRAKLSISNSITEPILSRHVKVVALGSRATSALQFCHESALLSSAELWISSGDAVDHQLLSRLTEGPQDGQQFNEVPRIVICVIGAGAGLCAQEVAGILESSRVQGSLAVTIIIQPFTFEGLRRKKELEVLAGALFEHSDLCLVFEYDALSRKEKVKLTDALKLADNTVLYAIKAISDLCMGDQIKVFDAPPEGLRDITTSEILSMLLRAGNAWVGFGSSYSVKSAVQRAAFESPFLKGLFPGVKGLIACTISSADEKGKRDLQTALHALRCIIGPRAQLVCTCTREPTLKQGVIHATLLFTRIENAGIQDNLKHYTLLWDAYSSFPPSTGGSMGGLTSSMNGRELRRSSVEIPKEGLEGRSISAMLKEDSDSSVFTVDDSTGIGKLELSDVCYTENKIVEVPDNAVSSFDDTTVLGHIDRLPTFDAAETVVKPYYSCTPHEFLHDLDENLCQLQGDTSNEGLKQESYKKAVSEDISEMVGRPGSASNGIDSDLDMDDVQKFKFPNLPSILESGMKRMIGRRETSFVWESGPDSADAEAWAQMRQKLGALSGIDRNRSFQIPVGVRPVIENNRGIQMNDDQSKQWNLTNQVLLDFAAPLSNIITNGLETVGQICNAASSKLFRKAENEGPKQSYSLSQRASSMLESERSQVELTPIVEMKYKNGVYRGRCTGGLPDGKGRLSFVDGGFYEGMWKQGIRVGIGSFYYANGDVFRGSWRDDQMHGKGWFYFHTGERLYADFWKGKANGEGRYYSYNGDVYFGNFRDGWRHGKSISIEDGIRWFEIWDDGILVSRTLMENSEEPSIVK